MELKNDKFMLTNSNSTQHHQKGPRGVEENDQNEAFLGGFSYMKIPQESQSFHQKEPNCFRHPQFYSSIAPMQLLLCCLISTKLRSTD